MAEGYEIRRNSDGTLDEIVATEDTPASGNGPGPDTE